MVVRYALGDADDRPWGRWEVIATGDAYCSKRITVAPGGKLSLQLHHHRAEHWIIVAGRPRVTIGDARQDMRPGDHVHIALGQAHRIENPGSEPVVFIEVQYGETLDEDDIVRLDDVYGRAPAKPA